MTPSERDRKWVSLLLKQWREKGNIKLNAENKVHVTFIEKQCPVLKHLKCAINWNSTYLLMFQKKFKNKENLCLKNCNASDWIPDAAVLPFPLVNGKIYSSKLSKLTRESLNIEKRTNQNYKISGSTCI